MSKHQFTDIRVAIEPDNPAVQRLEFKCIKCGSCKAVCTDYIGVCGTRSEETRLNSSHNA